jgi:hypothetical protein
MSDIRREKLSSSTRTSHSHQVTMPSPVHIWWPCRPLMPRQSPWVRSLTRAFVVPGSSGTFIEYRTGMLNISPIGRNCDRAERDAFEVYDLVGRTPGAA